MHLFLLICFDTKKKSFAEVCILYEIEVMSVQKYLSKQ